MSKFYGTVHGDASRSDGTRRGFHEISVTAQSYEGSINITMYENPDGSDNHLVTLSCREGESIAHPQDEIMTVTLEQFFNFVENFDPAWLEED